MTRKIALDDAIEKRQLEATNDGDRYVDLAIDVVWEGDPQNVEMHVGARWDRRLDDFDDADPQTSVTISVHAGQVMALAWFKRWFETHRDRRDTPPPPPDEIDGEAPIDTDPTRVYSALFAGGRRGGKSWFAVACAVMYAVAFPKAIVWLVSKDDGKHDELRRYFGDFCAPQWVESESVGGWTLINGAVILLKSAHNPESLKEGTAHFVVLNEGQRMKERAYIVARGAIVDKAGLVLVCANPPVEAGDQQWVANFAAESAAGRRASVYIEFNPLDNPHIDRRALLSMRAELDERTFAIEVLGQFRGPRDAVAYNWIRLYNEGPPPSEPDITEALMQIMEEGDGILQVVGLDVQQFPHIGGPVYRFFGEAHVDKVKAWIVDEVALEGGTETEFCDALMAKGYEPESTLIVCDASGRYQHSMRRSMDSPPSTWTGRGSFDIIRNAGFYRIVPPDRRLKVNPHVVDRVRAFTSMICTSMGVRRLFCDPIAAPKTAHAIREWRTLHGQPHRRQLEAHLGDGASYPIVRLFPRKLRSGNTADMDPIASRVDRAGDTPPTGGPNTRARRVDRTRGIV